MASRINPFKAQQQILASHMGGQNAPALNVIHSTVGPTKVGSALAVANMFAHETLATSAHYVFDEAADIQCVPDHQVAYHCGYNHDSLSYEMCDYPNAASGVHWWKPKSQQTGPLKIVQHAKIKPIRWMDPAHHRMLNRTARAVAQNSLAYGIPIRLLTDAQLRQWDANGRRPQDGGIVTHAQMSRVFHMSTHWDPGKWPARLFLVRVKFYARKIQAMAAA